MDTSSRLGCVLYGDYEAMKATYSDLHEDQQRLVRIMQWLNYGKIENLHVRAGLPDWDVSPTFRRNAKMDGEGMPRHEMDSHDFFLKDCHMALWSYLDYIQDGVIDYLDVKHGLPFLMQFEDVPK